MGKGEMMDWKLIDEYNANAKELEEYYEKISALLDRQEEIEVQLRKGQNHV